MLDAGVGRVARRVYGWVQRPALDMLEAVFPARCHACARLVEPAPRQAGLRGGWRFHAGLLTRALPGGCRVPLRLLCAGCAANIHVEPTCWRMPAGWSRLGGYRPTPELFALLHAMKYRGLRELAPAFGAAMFRALRDALPPRAPVVVVPVPLHPARERARGFNQSALLAAAVARRGGWPVQERLRRRRDTPALARLAHAQRAAAVAGAFERCPGGGPRGAHLVLVDDVITTGATAQAAVAALGQPASATTVLTVCDAGRGVAGSPGGSELSVRALLC